MLYCYCVALLLFVLSYVLICVLYHCHRVLTQLQLTNISISMSLSVVVLCTVKPTHNKCYQAVRARPYGTTTSWKATGQRFVSGPKLALWQDRAAFARQSSLEAKNIKSVRWLAGWLAGRLAERKPENEKRSTSAATNLHRRAHWARCGGARPRHQNALPTTGNYMQRAKFEQPREGLCPPRWRVVDVLQRTVHRALWRVSAETIRC